MKKFTSTGLVAFALLFGVACENSSTKQEDSVETAQEANENKADSLPSNSETNADAQSDFMTEAASSSMMEVVLGKMAANQANHAEVKSFAQMMVTHHTKANDEMKTLAASKNVTLPERVGTNHQKHVDKLADLRGADFDREYLNVMVEAHQKDIEQFREASTSQNQDAAVKAFATKSLPMLEDHLKKAQELQEKVKNTKS